MCFDARAAAKLASGDHRTAKERRTMSVRAHRSRTGRLMIFGVQHARCQQRLVVRMKPPKHSGATIPRAASIAYTRVAQGIERAELRKPADQCLLGPLRAYRIRGLASDSGTQSDRTIGPGPTGNALWVRSEHGAIVNIASIAGSGQVSVG